MGGEGRKGGIALKAGGRRKGGVGGWVVGGGEGFLHLWRIYNCFYFVCVCFLVPFLSVADLSRKLPETLNRKAKSGLQKRHPSKEEKMRTVGAVTSLTC